MSGEFWGYLVWLMLHSMGLVWRKKTVLTDEESKIIESYMRQMCTYLICGPCASHCVMYVTSNPPIFKSGNDFYVYINDFHNAVNKRTNKITYTLEESDKKTLELLKGLEPEEAFSDQFWMAMLLTTYRYYAPEKTEAKKEEQDTYKKHLNDWCRVVSFGFYKVEEAPESKCISDLLCDKLCEINLETRDLAFKSLVDLYNVAAPYFNVLPQTEVQIREKFNSLFAHGKHVIDLSRAETRHKEDQLKLVEYQKELANLANKSATAQINDYKIATITLACVLGLVLLGVIVLIVVWKKQKWRLIRNGGKELINQP